MTFTLYLFLLFTC